MKPAPEALTSLLLALALALPSTICVGHVLLLSVSLGRLDFNTRGLLLLTNNSTIANAIENPRNRLVREYVALVRGNVSVPWLKSLQNGIKVDGVRYRPVKAKVLKVCVVCACVHVVLSMTLRFASLRDDQLQGHIECPA